MAFTNDHGNGDMFNSHMSTQNNNTGSGNQFSGSTFYGPVNFPQNTQNEGPLQSRQMDVLKRLNVSKYRDQKDRNPVRVRGTCDWFVTHPTFRAWQETQTSQMLWVTADPGCGKSVLAKYLVDSVLTSHAGRKVGYFFFKDDFEDQRSIQKALCCILHQLFYQNRDLLTAHIIEQFEMDERIVDSFGSLWNVLISAAKQTDTTEIICLLDAFDECEPDGRSQLTVALERLYTDESRHNFNLKFLITSRLYGDIRQGFQPMQMEGQPLIHLSGEGTEEMEDISREIKTFIKARVETIGARLKLTEEEKSILLKSVTRVPNTTYLWVYLTLNLIENIKDIDKTRILDATSDLPKTVDDAYERILSRSEDCQKARKLLHIVVGATRPLTLQEMNLALILSEKHQSYRELELRSEDRIRENIRDLCGLFITVVEGKIYLLHQTVREFLIEKNKPPIQGNTSDSKLRVLHNAAWRNRFRDTHKRSNDSIQSLSWKHSLKLQESHKIILRICIQYLLLSDFRKTLPRRIDIGKLTNTYILLDYSTRSWATHFLEAKDETDNMKQSLVTLCDLIEDCCPAWFQVYWASLGTKFPTGFNSLMIGAYFGLIPVVQHWIEIGKTDVDAEDDIYGRSALSWASGNGHTTVIKLLIKRSYRTWWKMARVDARDRHNRTPLSWAIINGQVEAVSLLLKAGAVIDLKDDIGGTPLGYAICSGNNEVWNIVKKKGSQNHHLSIGKIQTRLLISAARKGNEAIVTLLLENKADIESKDRLGQTPLSWAAENGHEAVVRLLLENMADIESKDRLGQTPLFWAVENGHKAVVRLLLEYKTNIESRDKYGRTPLLWAASNGHEAVVRLLLENKADIESRDNMFGHTPLSCAARNGHEAVVRLLLENKADIESRDNMFGETPLLWAAHNGHKAVVGLLSKYRSCTSL
ncbi:ankyrin repeat-containing protein [Aspergillus flavus AF70]|nr:ankyrin repeat-containing protein [Aspergillus flavus AF70]